MLRVRYLVPLAILWLVAATTDAAGQGADADAPKTRTAFEALLLQRANPMSLATDGAGAWHNAYRFLPPAHFLDRRLYEQALLQLAGNEIVGCEKARERRARLACIAHGAASVASSLTLFAEAALFRRDALEFAESIAARDPGPLIDILLSLAHDEWSHGSMLEAESAVQRTEALLAGRHDAGTPERRLQVAVLKARLADARLDDAAALAALSEAVSAQLANASRSGVDGGLSSLFLQHLNGRFCPNCGRPAEPLERWLNATLEADLGTDIRSFDPTTPNRSGLLQVLVAVPPGTVPAAWRRSYLRKFLAAEPSKKVAGVRKLLPRRADDVETARMLLLSYVLEGGSPFFNEQPILAFLRERHPRRKAILLREHLDRVADENFAQFGNDIALPAAFEAAARDYEHGGWHDAARITLEYLINWQRKREFEGRDDRSFVNDSTIRQAGVFVPALARLAALQLAAGDGAAAGQSLDHASAVANAKLHAEWEQGGERAILTMRDLSEALQLIAQTRHALLAPKRFAENPQGADALFRAMQAAITGETALTLEVARQRRILTTPRLADLRREHLRARAEAAHLVEIALRYKDFDYDGAILRAHREAEAQRDRLAAELGQLPASLAAADIEPVGLAEAQKSLADGEAIVLLRAGSASLEGFLLDREGGTTVWRTAVARDELDALVKSLRAGADMTTGHIPDFNLDDAARLHELIFGPVRSRLADFRKLIVLGDGPLQSLPYGILLTRKAERAPKTADDYRAAALPWLVRTHAIALVPSVRSLVSQRSGAFASEAPRPFLGVGNPQLAQHDAAARRVDVGAVFGGSSSGLADIAMLRRLASLPETEAELRQIADVLRAEPADVIVGKAANEAAVKALPLARYRIIAFATHGALAGEVSGSSEPGLVLTPPLQASAEDDGFLSLSEIANLKLDADLIILSACNTGTSDGRPRAESLSGLARGFFSAGARSLLVTHWTIPSDSAVKTTTGLIAARARNSGLDWADALREATLAIIDHEGPPEWAHPTFWGAYTAIGVLPR